MSLLTSLQALFKRPSFNRRYRHALRTNMQLARKVISLEANEKSRNQSMRELQDELDKARAQIAVLEAQIEMLTAWQARELERLRAETAMQTARKIIATDNPKRLDEDRDYER